MANTIIDALRDAVTATGDTPTRYDEVGLLRELITAWGGTPVSYSVVELLKEAASIIFSPTSLFASGEAGAFYDVSDLTSMFQDSAGTTAAVVGQPVGRINDKSGRGNHATQATTSLKPILRSDGTNYYLEFDGADDFLTAPSVNFTATDKMTVAAGVQKASDAVRGMIAELDAAASTAGKFTLTGPDFAAQPSFGMVLVGATASTYYQAQTFAAPVKAVVSATLDISGATRAANIQLRVNGAANATGGGGSNAGLGGGNFGNLVLYIGRRGGTTLPFSGRLYGLVVRGATSNADQIARLEADLASKSGVTL